MNRITEELRAIYQNTNEGPRLIAEMVEREFPVSLEMAMRFANEELEDEIARRDRRIAKLENLIEKLENLIEKLTKE